MSDSDQISTDRLRAIDVFAELSDEQLEEIARLASPRTYDEGDELLHAGEWPEDLLALEEGSVEVRKDDEVLATVEAGSVVGERGVLRRALRNADVVATSPVKALFFHRNKVTTMRKDIPEIDERLAELAEAREG